VEFLLDTNVVLWSQLSPSKLSKRVHCLIEEPFNVIYYSPLSMWEISIKYGNRKLFLNGGTPDDFFIELTNSFYLCKTINPITFISSYKLPIYHKDPFDRLLIWETMRSDFILISSDEKMDLYKKEGLRVIH